jgi:hypothetical protein
VFLRLKRRGAESRADDLGRDVDDLSKPFSVGNMPAGPLVKAQAKWLDLPQRRDSAGALCRDQPDREDPMTASALAKAHDQNITRYYRLLQTRLSEVERNYIESRILEERAALQALVSVDRDHAVTDAHVAAPMMLG